MNRSILIAGFIAFAAGTGSGLPGPVCAQGHDAGWSAAPGYGQGSDVDWIRHTQASLDELRRKLSLDPAQAPAWAAWSDGVLKDAHHQLERKHAVTAHVPTEVRTTGDLSTPGQMARGIQRLRAQTDWMQRHLADLEAAQQRTRIFYDALDDKQQTIFDLYWHEMHHRVSGHDGDWPAAAGGDLAPGQDARGEGRQESMMPGQESIMPGMMLGHDATPGAF